MFRYLAADNYYRFRCNAHFSNDFNDGAYTGWTNYTKPLGGVSLKKSFRLGVSLAIGLTLLVASTVNPINE
jgi:hypothetical protein